MTELKNIPKATSKFKYLLPKGYEDFIKIGQSIKLVDKIYLLKMFDNESSSSNSKYVIYAFFDNVFFLKQFIIEGGLTLSNIYIK